MQFIKLVFLLSIISSCKSDNTNKSIYPEDLFTQSEVAEISLMLKEFKEVACEKKENSPDCIKTYFENYWINFKKGHIKTQIDSNALSKIVKPLSDKLKSKLFSENMLRFENNIPNTSPHLRIPDTIKYMAANTQKSFLPLLKHLSEKYSNLNEVKESINKSQDLIPHNVRMIYSNFSEYEYSENTELLFLSLIIISQADESIKRELSYSKAINPIENELKNRYKNKK